MAIEFKTPNLGENVSSGTVGRVLVKTGDLVETGQPILELETDKAVTEITSPANLKVAEVRVSEGQQVKVGDVLITYEEAELKHDAPARSEAKAASNVEQEAEASSAQEEAPAKPQKELAQGPGQPPKLKVYSPSSTDAAEAGNVQRAPAPAPQPQPVAARAAGAPVVAAPSVRKMAREMGINLQDVPVADPSGRVSAQDILAYSQRGRTEGNIAPAPQPEAAHAAGATAPTPQPVAAPQGAVSDDRWGQLVHEPMNGVRKKTVQHMSHSWSTIPHVTHFEKADISGLEASRQAYGKAFEANGGKLTVTVFLVKMLAMAIRKFPKFNARIDIETEEVLYRQYCNVGVAVDTPNGLLVPVIRDADKKTMQQLAQEIPALAAKARDRKLALEDMQGGSITLTNLGGVGGGGFQSFTPIINAPEVAILGVSRAAYEPVFENGAFVPRLRLPLALSYDHRLIDGADAARFMKWYVQAIEQPWTLFLDA